MVAVCCRWSQWTIRSEGFKDGEMFASSMFAISTISQAYFLCVFDKTQGLKKLRFPRKLRSKMSQNSGFPGFKLPTQISRTKILHFGFLAIKLGWLFTKLMVFTEKLRV